MQDADEAHLLGGAGDLAEVADGRRPVAPGHGDRGAVAAADDVAAVAVGGQEPVEGERHGGLRSDGSRAGRGGAAGCR